MRVSDFRRIALSLPEATEGAHMGHPDFRVKGKVFATLFSPGGEEEQLGMVKLTPEQQRRFIKDRPEVFQPVKGGWGRSGATQVRLGDADRDLLRSALLTAWLNTAPKKLKDAFEAECHE